MNEGGDNLWLHLFPGLPERWREERRLVEERFSLFRAFAGVLPSANSDHARSMFSDGE